MPKVALGVLAVLTVVLALWLWPRADQGGTGSGVATRASEPRSGAASSAGAPEAMREAVERDSLASRPASAIAAPAALLVTTLWKADRTPAPCIGVTVALEDGGERREAVTGDDGRAQFATLAPGPTLVASDRGPRARVELAAGEQREVVLELEPGRDVEGSVVDADGTPVQEADIWLEAADLEGFPVELGAYGTQRVARSDRFGAFRLRGLQRGQELFARKAGYSPSPRTYPKEGEAAVRLVLPARGATLCVRVLAAGRPLERATVTAWLARREGTAYASLFQRPPIAVLRTDATGRSCADDLPAGTTHVFAEARGFQRTERSLVLETGKTGELEVELSPAATVRGRVCDRDGKPLPRISVAIETEGIPHHDWVQTGADGRYLFDHAVPGKLSLRFEARGHGAEQRTGELAAGQTLVLDAALAEKPVPRLRGKLQDESGRALEGWGLHALPVTRDPQGLLDGRTGTGGKFAIEAREGVAYSLRAQEPAAQRWVACAGADALVPSDREAVVTVRDRDLPSAFVSGRLVDAAGAPVSRAALAVGEPWEAGLGREDRCDERGSFRIGPLPPGAWRLRTTSLSDSDPNVPPADLARFELLPKEDKDLGTLRVPRGSVISYRMLDPAGHEITGVGAWVTAEDEVPIASVSDKSGHGQLRLLPGRYVLYVAGLMSWAGKRIELEVVAGTDQSLDIVCRPAVRRELSFRWPPGAGPQREQSARFRFLQPGGDVWEWTFPVEPGDRPGLSECLAVGHHEVTLTLDDGTRYAGRFDLATLQPTRDAIEVALEAVR